MRIVHLVVALALCAAPLGAAAQGLPQIMPYQGFISTEGGAPVQDPVTLTFRIYEARDAVAPVWQETLQDVPVGDGWFYVYLGMLSPVMNYVTDGRTRYLGISVNGEAEAEPRQRIGSVPYAMYAGDAETLGGESPDVFVTVEELNQELVNRQFVTQVNIEEVVERIVQQEVIERQGLSLEDLERILDERGYLTEEEINALIDARGYLTEVEIQALIDAAVVAGGGGLDADAVNALIDARSYVTEEQVTQLINQRIINLEGGLDAAAVNALIDARNYLSEDAINALIDARNYVDEADVNALIDARNYVSRDEIEQLIDARVQQVVQQELQNVQNQIQQLQQQIQNIQAGGGGAPYILGRSAQSSTGRFTFNGSNGLAAANAMCQATFADEPTAHLCGFDEVQRALATSSYNQNNNFSNVVTWTVAPALSAGQFAGSLANTCQNLMYNSGDVARGTTLRAILNYQSNGGGGGLTGHAFVVQREVGCGGNFPVLCCR